jgi:gliding motility-associated protein GldM
MSLPKEPRQKMINIMYLVLTALLALNVSSEILNAFKTVNNSLVKTNTAVNASTDQIMSSLSDKRSEPGTAQKANIWYPRAEQVTLAAKKVNDLIQGFKNEILKASGGDPNNLDKTYKEDNLDVATRMMIKQKKGQELLKALTEFKATVGGVGGDSVKAEIEKMMQIDIDKPKTPTSAKKSWEEVYFHMVPSVAALTILSKFQNDVKTTENKVVNFCHEQVGKVVLRFNQYEPIVGQSAAVLLPGQELEIKAGLAAFNSDKKPSVTINGSNVQLDDKGLAVWKTTVNSSGTVRVVVNFTDQDGNPQSKPYDVQYTVGQSSAAVQLDKMNVLFIGVDNPVTVSGSGDLGSLSVSGTGGGISLVPNGPGKYFAKVNSETNDCFITITSKEGKTTRVPFRVRSIPDPTPYVGQVKSGEMGAGAFKSQAGVRALVENFFYETQFNVTSFRITGDGEGFDDVEEKINSGAAWNEARAIINKCRSGSFITIEDIRAVGPDGRTRKLTPMIFNLK